MADDVSSTTGDTSHCDDGAYLSWNDYFMALACMTAKRSKDPVTKVGACIVNQDRRVVALGYNGMPDGCNDSDMPWGQNGNWEETKHPYVCHAEMNAIMNKTSADLKNCTLFTTLFPCNECTKLIIQSGIRSVVYLATKDQMKPKFLTSLRLLDMTKIKHRKITIDFEELSHVGTKGNTESEDADSTVGRQ